MSSELSKRPTAKERFAAAKKKYPVVVFSGKKVHLRLIAVEPGAPDQTFEIHKLVDPAVSVKAGARIKITLLNMDFGPGMMHGVVIGKIKPPFPMMVNLPVRHQLLELPMMLPRTRKAISKGSYYSESRRFRAPDRPGVYYYFCQMPMHAMQGMYGKFIVRK
jgi:rusticyanin